MIFRGWSQEVWPKKVIWSGISEGCPRVQKIILVGWSTDFLPNNLIWVGVGKGSPNRREGHPNQRIGNQKSHKLFMYIHFNFLVSKAWSSGWYSLISSRMSRFESHMGESLC